MKGWCTVCDEKAEIEDFCDYCATVIKNPDACKRCLRHSQLTDMWEPTDDYPQ